MAKFVMQVIESFVAEVIVEAEDFEAAYELTEALVMDNVIDLAERKPYSRYSLDVENLGDVDEYLSKFHNWMPDEERVYSKEDLSND